MHFQKEWYNAGMETIIDPARRIGLYRTSDGSRYVASPEIVSKPIIATGYAQAYQIAFGRISPYDGENDSVGEKLALEQAGYVVTIVP